MEFNALTVIIITVVATVALIGAGSIFVKTKKANPDDPLKENFGEAWNKIRPILSELFINVFTIYQADQGGFEELLDFSVSYMKNKINDADFLYQEEKELFTEEFIRSIIEPRMKELYSQHLRV